jgi:CRISPR/Cas system Type II protein with McrA/HNH and RuvC-like nuclease domain
MNTTHCYLTGRLIDLNDISSYSLDHIVPFSKSLDNSVNNLGVCCRDVNKSKSDLSIQEYVALCKEVVEYYN